MRHVFQTYLNLAEFLSEDFKLEEGKDYFFKAINSNTYRLKINANLGIVRLFFLQEEIEFMFGEIKIKTFNYKTNDIKKIKQIITQIVYNSKQIDFLVKTTNDKITEILKEEN